MQNSRGRISLNPLKSEKNPLLFGGSLPNFTKRTSPESGSQAANQKRVRSPDNLTRPDKSPIPGTAQQTRNISHSPGKNLTLKIGLPRAVGTIPPAGSVQLPQQRKLVPAIGQSTSQPQPPKKKLLLFSLQKPKQTFKMPVLQRADPNGSFEDPFENETINPERRNLIDSSQKPLIRGQETRESNSYDDPNKLEATSVKNQPKGRLNLKQRGGEFLLKLSSRDKLLPADEELGGHEMIQEKKLTEEKKISHLFAAVGSTMIPDTRGVTPILESSAEKSQKELQSYRKQMTNQSANVDNFFRAMASFQGRAGSASKPQGPYAHRVEKSSLGSWEGSVPNLELKLKAERLDFLASQEIFLKMFDRREKALARWRTLRSVVKGSSLLRAVDPKEFIKTFEGNTAPAQVKRQLVIMPSSFVKYLIYLVKICALMYNFFYIQIM